MNVIAGSARSLKLVAPEGLDTRPTGARIKESLFNIISNDLYDCDFLDLFAGSGAMGIEALSRGAKSAVFVDLSEESIKAVRRNLEFTRLADRATVIKSDVVGAITSLRNSFDIIFMDAPYSKGLTQKALDAIAKAKILKENGFIIAEQAIDEEIPEVEGFKIFRIKEYKISKMTFIGYENAEN